MTHLSESEILTASDDHPHLAGCDPCRGRVVDFRKFTKTLRAPRVWIAEDPQRLPRSPRRSIVDRAALLEEEEDEAAPATAALVADPSGADAILARFAPTAGLLHAVLEAAHALLQTNPEKALEVTRAAAALAARLDWSAYPDVVAATARGRIHKEAANALRHLGRHDDGLAAAEAAIREYEGGIATDHQIAVADYIAASILREKGSLDDALARVKRAAGVFGDFGDAERLMHCRMLEAVITAAAGRQREARDLLLVLLPEAQAELSLRAQIHNNIGQLSIELGDADLAGPHLLQALVLYRELGMTREEIRTNWGVAKLLERGGKAAEARARFVEAEQAFLGIGMEIEAALVALDRIEAELASSASADTAAECRQLHETFRDRGLTANALAALAYLSESLADGAAARPALTRVRSYLERLPAEPALLFLEI